MTAKDVWERPTAAQVVHALDTARELVRGGWVQRQAYALIDGVDCYCAMGAVAEASGTIRLSWPVLWHTDDAIPGRVVPGAWLRDAVTAALLAALPPRFGTVAAYNDTPARTQAEIVALFNSAITIAQAVAA